MMDKTMKEQLSHLKEDLLVKIRESDNIDKIVNKKIDREFPFDMAQVSDSELDSKIHQKMTAVNEDLFYVKHKYNSSFNRGRILSSRIFNNKPVKLLFFPLYLLFYIPRKIGRVFENLLLINQMLPYRFHRYNLKIKELEEKIRGLEFKDDTPK